MIAFFNIVILYVMLLAPQDCFSYIVKKDRIRIVNRTGTTAYLELVQHVECKTKKTETRKSITLFDGLTETYYLKAPLNCTISYGLSIKIPQLNIDQISELSDVNLHQFEIYGGRQGEPVLQSIPIKLVRPDVSVQNNS
jgi:hypothetical protein